MENGRSNNTTSILLSIVSCLKPAVDSINKNSICSVAKDQYYEAICKRRWIVKAQDALDDFSRRERIPYTVYMASGVKFEKKKDNVPNIMHLVSSAMQFVIPCNASDDEQLCKLTDLQNCRKITYIQYEMLSIQSRYFGKSCIPNMECVAGGAWLHFEKTVECILVFVSVWLVSVTPISRANIGATYIWHDSQL